MKKLNGIVWGIVLVAAGVLLGLNAFGITDIDIFFDGWWTLFIIVPCAVGLITDRDKLGSLIGICVGVFLLLCCRDVLDFSMVWKLLVPIIVVLIGLKLIIGGIVGDRSSEVFKKSEKAAEHRKTELRCSREATSAFPARSSRVRVLPPCSEGLTAIFAAP